MSAMRQIPLFSPEAEEERTCREQLMHLGAAYAALDEQYTALHQAHRTIEQELGALRRALAAAETRARCFATLVGERPGPTTTGQALAPLLKQLLTLAHPDKWSQGQPASELAHEVSIRINAIRQEVEP